MAQKREVKDWITVNGVHVPIFEGESKKDAIKRRLQERNQSPKEKQIAKAKEVSDKLNKEQTIKDLTNQAQTYVKKLRDNAIAHSEKVTNDLQKAVGAGTGKLIGLEFKIKGEGSLRDKLVRKALEKNISVEEYSKRVTDVLRFTNQSTEDNLVNDFSTVRGQLEKNGYEMIEVSNTWYDGSVYKGINTLVKTPDGYVYELQFHTQQSFEIKEINHKLYEQSRAVGTPQDEKDRLELQMKANAKKVKTPKNIDSIK